MPIADCVRVQIETLPQVDRLRRPVRLNEAELQQHLCPLLRVYSVRQIAEICLFSSATYKCTVAELDSDEGLPIHPNQTGWCKVFKLRPSINDNRDKQGLALDGKLKHEDTNLASSTMCVALLPHPAFSVYSDLGFHRNAPFDFLFVEIFCYANRLSETSTDFRKEGFPSFEVMTVPNRAKILQ